MQPHNIRGLHQILYETEASSLFRWFFNINHVFGRLGGLSLSFGATLILKTYMLSEELSHVFGLHID